MIAQSSLPAALIVVGTRPEAIKLAPVVSHLRASHLLRPVVCVTGQHRELLDNIISDFGIEADIRLHAMAPGQSLNKLTARLFSALDEVLETAQPACVLVQGDTTSSLAGAVAAFHRGIPVGHVEAGLRSGDMTAPFPEEFNRRGISLAARWHFAPTQGAADNLLREGVSPSSIFLTGNTVVDALLRMRSVVRNTRPPLPEQVERLLASETPFVLVTAHRRENLGQGMEGICEAVAALADRHRDHAFLWTLHANPQAREAAQRRLAGLANVVLTPACGYPAFLRLLDACHFVMSDSGGVQEEAPSLGKRVLVLRRVTERPEGVAAGFCTLVGTEPADIIQAANPLFVDATPPGTTNPYGDGHAAERIVDTLECVLD